MTYTKITACSCVLVSGLLLSACQSSSAIQQTTKVQKNNVQAIVIKRTDTITDATQKADNKVTKTKDTEADAPVLPKNTKATTKNNKDTVATIQQPFSFAQAQTLLAEQSHKLQAEKSGLLAEQYKHKALSGLRLPKVTLSTGAGRRKIDEKITKQSLAQRMGGGNTQVVLNRMATSGNPEAQASAQALGQDIKNIQTYMMFMDDLIPVTDEDNYSKVRVNVQMPLYSGGQISGTQKLAKGKVLEQQAVLDESLEQVQVDLVQKYFAVQLAKKAVRVREKALVAVQAHDKAAQRMLEVGLIANAERLQGKAAVADAQRQLRKSKDSLRLAKRAFDILMQKTNTQTTTGLFINRTQLLPLEFYQEQALQKNPIFGKLDAKMLQAKAVKKMRDAAWHPRISAYAMHEINKESDNWNVGLNASWTLHGSVSRHKMQHAATESIEKVAAMKKFATANVGLLVEKHWLAVTDAVTEYDALLSEEKLMSEVVELRNKGFKNGLNTLIELNDAQARLSKIRTQRANAAYEYVVSLAQLLTVSRQFESFTQFIDTADVRINK